MEEFDQDWENFEDDIFAEVFALEEFISELDNKLDRQTRSKKTKNGIRLFTPFFGKFPRCECFRSRSHAGEVIGILVKGGLKKRFTTVEMRLKEFAKDNQFSDDFKLVKNGIVWAKVPTHVPKNFVGDVTIRFDRIYYGDNTVLTNEVVGITRFENGEEERLGQMSAETALTYLKDHNEV